MCIYIGVCVWLCKKTTNVVSDQYIPLDNIHMTFQNTNIN